MSDQALVARANAALARDDLDDALAALVALIARHPGNTALTDRAATVLNNRGARRARRGDIAAAAADWHEALRFAPRSADALLNLGRLHAGERQWRDAVAVLARAAEVAPDDAEVALELAEARASVGAGDDEALADALRDAIVRARASGRVDALRLAAAAATLGDAAAARADFDAAPPSAPASLWLDAATRWREAGDAAMVTLPYRVALSRGVDDLRVVLASHLALPLVYRDRDEMAAARARFADGVAAIRDRLDPADTRLHARSLDELQWTNQVLAYQGGVDRDLVAPYGDWLAAMSSRLAPAVVRDGLAPRRAGRPRIGICLSSWRGSAMLSYFGAWLPALVAAGLDVTMVAFDAREDDATARLAARATSRLVLHGDLAANAATLHATAFDLLLYPDATVDPRVHVLASLRLARAQVAGWGHPDTTGLPTLDAYLSVAAMEPEDAPSHYRERLVALPQLGTRYDEPPPADAGPLASLDLPRGRRYLVPHVAPKLHVDFDAVLAEVAARDPDGTILLVGIAQPALRARLRERIGRAMHAAGADPSRQLRCLPRVPLPAFVALAQACTLMLDPPHWSGGANAYDGLASGLPLVTTPGITMRARQSHAMVRALGVADELAVDRIDALAERAVAIARDDDRRAAIVDTITTNRARLFAADDAFAALAACVRELASR